MPRKNPLPDREIEICRRLRAFREELGLSRVVLAQRSGLATSEISRYEHHRVCVRYGAFRAVNHRFKINPIWLATGGTVPVSYEVLDDSQFFNSSLNTALFSEVYDRFIRASEERLQRTAEQVAHRMMQNHKKFVEMLKRGQIEIEPDLLQEIVRATQTLSNATRRALIKSESMDRRLTAIREEEPEVASNPAGKENSKTLLTTISFLEDKGEVKWKPQWPPLLERLRKLTAARGAKARLANEIGSTAARVSDWLKKKKAKEPSAEWALRLRIWADKQPNQ